MSAPFWHHTPQKYWFEEDWRKWEQAGSPRVPREMRLSAEMPAKRLDDSAPAVHPQHLLGGFDLYAKPNKGNRRSRSIDSLLEKVLGRR